MKKYPTITLQNQRVILLVIVGVLVLFGVLYIRNFREAQAVSKVEGTYCGTINQARSEVGHIEVGMQDCFLNHFQNQQPATLVAEIIVPETGERLSTTYLKVVTEGGQTVIRRTEMNQMDDYRYDMTYLECEKAAIENNEEIQNNVFRVYGCQRVDSAGNYGDFGLRRP